MKNLSFHNQKRCNAGTINTVKALKASRGSATVEAAVILPVIIIVFISILSIIRIAGTYDRVQYALNQVAADLSQYSYLYTVLGLQEGHDEIIDDIENAKMSFQTAKRYKHLLRTIQSITGDISFTDRKRYQCINRLSR